MLLLTDGQNNQHDVTAQRAFEMANNPDHWDGSGRQVFVGGEELMSARQAIAAAVEAWPKGAQLFEAHIAECSAHSAKGLEDVTAGKARRVVAGGVGGRPCPALVPAVEDVRE